MIKIIADENIAFASEAFSSLGEVKLLHGREITNKTLRQADALITRSITRVNRSLLRNTPVSFVGTATIGTDHIDLHYLEGKNISFADAKGCNADAVAEYVFAAIYSIAASEKRNLSEYSIGIIGVGNIGSRVARIASAAGLKVLLNDPPLKRISGNNIYLELDEVLKADIITLHVPLTTGGPDATYHLFDERKLKKLKDGAIFINASRGEIVSNSALLKELKKRKLISVIDVWENEPYINHKLLKYTVIGTPHIAGYSIEGKINGTMMIYQSLCRHLGVTPEWEPEVNSNGRLKIEAEPADSDEETINRIIKNVYDINSDDEEMRGLLKFRTENAGRYFDSLRKEYPLRREFNNYIINSGINTHLKTIATAMRFKVDSGIN
jgi:erythronate-4-phosphate dehydrogenase